MTIIAAPLQLSASGEYGFPVASAELALKLRVFVDGDQLCRVAAYDMAAGWCDCVAMDDNGMVMDGDEYALTRHHGKVLAVVDL